MQDPRKKLAATALAVLCGLWSAACGSGSGGAAGGGGTGGTHRLSGAIAGAPAGVTVTLTGAASRSTTTGSGGTFEFAGLPDGGYTLTPSLSGYTFRPDHLAVTLSGADQVAQAFTATATPAAGFTRVPVPTTSNLMSGWAGAPDDVWVFAKEPTLDPKGAYHWNGSAWTKVPGGGGYLAAWGSGPNDVWGAGPSMLLDHWDGHAWSKVTLVDASKVTSATLADAWGTSASDVWMAGGGIWPNGGIWHYDGTAWTLDPRTTDSTYGVDPSSVRAIWAESPAAVFAAGGTASASFDGTRWAGIPDSGLLREDLSLGAITALRGCSAGDLWAVGPAGLALHQEGSLILYAVATTTTENLNGVWCRSPTDVWAVGDAGTILHWDGIRFAAVPSGTTANLKRIWADAAGNLWVVGDAGTVLRSPNVSDAAHHEISGTLAGEYFTGVSVTLSGAASATATTGPTGLFHFAGLAAGTYAVAPSLPGYRFLPPSRQLTVGSADVRALDFQVAAEPQAPACSEGWCRDNPPLLPNTLQAAWGASGDDVWLVGGGGTMYHWDGSALLEVPQPRSLSFYGVWGSGTRDIWAVGSGGAIHHWDGSAWSVALRPGAPSIGPGYFSTTLRSVSGTSARDVWVVGDAGALVHWDGATWAAPVRPTTNSLVAVHAISPTDAWAVGNSVVLHWDGNAWTAISQTWGDLKGVWASSATDVWVISSFGIWRWNGASWTLPNPLPHASAFSASLAWTKVTGTSANDVWLVDNRGYLFHWDGSAWSTVAPDGIANWKYDWFAHLGIWASPAGDVWAVGDSIVHRTGGRWFGLYRTATAHTSFRRVWESATGDLWALSSATIYRRDATGWRAVATTPKPYLYGIWGAGPQDVWAVGASGYITHWDGTAWSQAPSPTTQSLYAVWGSGPSDVWSVGLGGTILHWNGTAWSSVSSPVTVMLTALWGTSPANAWAVGEKGTILRWNGTAWAAVMTIAASETLRAVHGSSATDVWAVGDAPPTAGYNYANVVHWDGASWTWVPSLEKGAMVDVRVNSATDAWSVAWGGSVWHWDGAAWSLATTSGDRPLTSIGGRSAADLWIVGQNGYVLRRAP